MALDDYLKFDVLIWWLPPLIIIILNVYSKIPENISMRGYVIWLMFWLLIVLAYFSLKSYGMDASNKLISENINFPVSRGDEFEMDGITWFRDSIDAPALGSWPLNTITYGVLFGGYSKIGMNVSVPCKRFCIPFKSLPVSSRNKLVSMKWNLDNIWIGVPYYVNQHFEKLDSIVQYWMDSSTQLQKMSDLINKPGEVLEGEVAKSGRVMAVARDVGEKKNVIQKLMDNVTGKEDVGENGGTV